MGEARRREQVRRSRPAGELEQRLAEQLGHLERSAAAFDEGHPDEAARMATAVWLICGDGKGNGLLQRLGFQTSTLFLSTARDVVRRHPARKSSIINMWGSSLVGIRGGPDPISQTTTASFEPNLDEDPDSAQWLSLKEWWRQPVLLPDPRRYLADRTVATFTRRHLVLWLRNQDGGGHVDDQLDVGYDDLLRFVQPIKVELDGVPHELSNPVPASMRQVAHEVLRSLDASQARRSVVADR